MMERERKVSLQDMIIKSRKKLKRNSDASTTPQRPSSRRTHAIRLRTDRALPSSSHFGSTTGTITEPRYTQPGAYMQHMRCHRYVTTPTFRPTVYRYYSQNSPGFSGGMPPYTSTNYQSPYPYPAAQQPQETTEPSGPFFPPRCDEVHREFFNAGHTNVENSDVGTFPNAPPGGHRQSHFGSTTGTITEPRYTQPGAYMQHMRCHRYVTTPTFRPTVYRYYSQNSPGFSGGMPPYTSTNYQSPYPYPAAQQPQETTEPSGPFFPPRCDEVHREFFNAGHTNVENSDVGTFPNAPPGGHRQNSVDNPEQQSQPATTRSWHIPSSFI